MYIGAICSFKNMLINDSNNVIKNAFKKKSKIDHSIMPDKRSSLRVSLGFHHVRLVDLWQPGTSFITLFRL